MTHVLDPLIGYLDQKPTEGCACKICEGCREGLRILVAAREGRQSEDLEIACRRAGNNGYQRGRAEGRREERERVVAWLNKRSEEAPSGPPYGGGPEEYMVLDGVAACIEDGDHWRGGESP